MEKQEKFALIIGLIAIIVMGLFFGKANPAPKAKSAMGNDSEYYPIFYVKGDVVRYPDYVEIEYDGNVYSAWIDAESELVTGDEVWCGFTIYEGNLELVDIKERG